MMFVPKHTVSSLIATMMALTLGWTTASDAQEAPAHPEFAPSEALAASMLPNPASVTEASDAAAATLPLTASPRAAAAAAGPNLFSVSGFGTLGLTHSNLRSADFTNTAFEPNGAGHTRRYDFANDSLIGVQLTAHISDKLSAVLQIISQQSYDNTFTPHVEWANIKYAFTSNFSIRVGRIDLPTFANSDYRNVGYANPWAHAPVEVYNNNPITHSDGVDTSYRFGIGPVINTVRVMYGYSTFHVSPGPIRAKATNLLGIFNTIEYGALNAHFAYTHGNVNLEGFPPGYDFVSATSYSVAVAYDPGTWFVQAELARVTVDAITPGYINGYLTAGYRIGNFTPYVTYAQSHSLGRATITGNLNSGQKDASVGVRWDFAKNFDLKAQYDHVWLPSDSTGSLSNIQPNYRLGTGTNVLSLVLDFVF